MVIIQLIQNINQHILLPGAAVEEMQDGDPTPCSGVRQKPPYHVL